MALAGLAMLAIALSGRGRPSGTIITMGLKEKKPLALPPSKVPVKIAKAPAPAPVPIPIAPKLAEARIKAAEIIKKTPALRETLLKPVKEFRPEETAAVFRIPKEAKVKGFTPLLEVFGTGITKPTKVQFPIFRPAQTKRATHRLEYYKGAFGNTYARWVPK